MINFAKIDPGFLSNRKIIKAGRNGRDVFLFVLLMNQSRGVRGWIPSEDLEPSYLARQLGISESDAIDGISRSTAARLIAFNEDRVEIVGWDEDWSRGPMSGAERTRNWRGKQPASSAAASSRLTSSGPSADDDPPVCDDENVTRDGEVTCDAERDRKKERESRVTRRSLSLDFSASPAAVEIVRARGLDLQHELAQFRSHAASNGRKSADWNEDFCKWLRNSRDTDRAPTARPQPPPPSGPVVKYERSRIQPGVWAKTVDGKYAGDWVKSDSDGWVPA